MTLSFVNCTVLAFPVVITYTQSCVVFVEVSMFYTLKTIFSSSAVATVTYWVAWRMVDYTFSSSTLVAFDTLTLTIDKLGKSSYITVKAFCVWMRVLARVTFSVVAVRIKAVVSRSGTDTTIITWKTDTVVRSVLA
jgi:hypothetical protein